MSRVIVSLSWSGLALVIGCGPDAAAPVETVGPAPVAATPTAPAPAPGTQTPGPSAPQAPAGADVPPAMRPLLDAHNRMRAAHCAPPLAWSIDLAAEAQAWADHIAASGCRLAHSGSSHGENLAAGSAGTLSPDGVAELWYGERAAFDFERGGFSMQTGHFTQLAWVATRRLGCGVVTCAGLDVYVCNYDPPGNVRGAYRDNVLPPSC